MFDGEIHKFSRGTCPPFLQCTEERRDECYIVHIEYWVQGSFKSELASLRSAFAKEYHLFFRTMPILRLHGTIFLLLYRELSTQFPLSCILTPFMQSEKEDRWNLVSKFSIWEHLESHLRSVQTTCWRRNDKMHELIRSRKLRFVHGCFHPSSCLTFLPGLAWVLLSKICKPFFLYFVLEVILYTPLNAVLFFIRSLFTLALALCMRRVVAAA